jgi:uncharacterized protein YukE
MTEILYNFAANNSALTDITGYIQAIGQTREDIDGIFNTLSTVYEGEGAAALNVARTKVSTMLEEVLNDIHRSQQQAQDQQDAMQALDRANAADFS